jgi:hypothetical protein
MRIYLWPVAFILGCTLSGLLSTGCRKSSVGAVPHGTPAREISAERTVLNEARAAESGSASDEEFAFPPDKEGQLLAKVLKPSDEPLGPLPAEGTKPRQFPALADLEQPQLPLPPSPKEMPLPALTQKTNPVRPWLLSEEPPFSRQQLALVPVESVKLPVGPRVRWTSPDVNQPIPLPILAGPVSDRISLDDPTGEISHSAALAQTVSDRTSPAPFLRLTLPEPFEHRQVVGLRGPPKEDEVPFSVLPGPSKP